MVKHLVCVCREEPNGAAVRTPSDDRLAAVLDRVVKAVSPSSFLTAFFLPALVHHPNAAATTAAALASGGGGKQAEQLLDDPYFLLPDTRLAASAGHGTDGEALRLAWARHRQLYLPLLVRLQRRYPGFASSLRRRLLLLGTTTDSSSSYAIKYGRWAQQLLTRDWHSHFAYGRGEALFSLRRAPGISFNLRDKPPENWTQPEADFMLAPASVDCLRRGLGSGLEEGEGGKEEEGEGQDDEGGWAVCERWAACPIGSH